MSGSPARTDDSVVASPTAATTTLLVCGTVGLVVALVSAVPHRDLLITLSGTLLVAGGLNHLLPTRDDLPPAVAESVFEASAEAIGTATGGSPVYVPAGGGRVWLRAGGGALETELGDDGVRPTGATMYRLIADDLPEGEPLEVTLARIGELLAGRFGLLVDPAVSVEGSEATVTVAGWALPALDRIDHPAVSVLAVGLAARTGEPVVADVHEDGDRVATIELRWGSDVDLSS